MKVKVGEIKEDDLAGYAIAELNDFNLEGKIRSNLVRRSKERNLERLEQIIIANEQKANPSPTPAPANP